MTELLLGLSPADLLPSVTLGAALTLPTGLSPYDAISDQYDVTGRGFYRLDATLQVDKSFRGFSSSLSAAYGKHLEELAGRPGGAGRDGRGGGRRGCRSCCVG